MSTQRQARISADADLLRRRSEEFTHPIPAADVQTTELAHDCHLGAKHRLADA